MEKQILLTKKQVAERLGITVRGVEGLMARRALPFYRLGNRTVRFDQGDLETWLEKVKVRSVIPG